LINSGLNQPFGIAIDNSGNLYISNFTNNTVVEQSSSSAGIPFDISPNLVGVSALGSVWLLSRLRKWRKSS
jgi:hypothetical protein